MIWTSIHLLHSNKPLNRQQCNHNLCMSWPLSVKHAAKITFANLKCRTFQSIIYPAEKKNFIGMSSILAWGKSSVGLPPPFIAIHIVRHIEQSVKGNLLAPKCSETLIISGSCVFLLPLPFELKFCFFEFKYVNWLQVQIKGFIWNFVECTP